MLYCGIDLAWGQKNTTAAVILTGTDDPSEGAALSAYTDNLLTDTNILQCIETHDDGSSGLLIGIDAPTLVPNFAGRRPCEAILSSCLRRCEAGPHPANRTLLAAPDGTVRGERIVQQLEERGIRHTPYLNTLPNPLRAAFEVFPHPAHIALFGLEKTLKYKIKPNRSLESRLAAFRQYSTLLQGLATADPPLRLPDDAFTLRDPAAFGSARALKQHEDALDALTCAYITLYRHRWGDARCPVVGDMTGGYIVTPATESMKVCFDGAARTGITAGSPR